jgi:PAT family beta-lactamase induction signal transducer AmpG
VLADAVEWVWFFILTAAWTIPAGGLLALILIAGPPASKGLYKFAERRTADEGA